MTSLPSYVGLHELDVKILKICLRTKNELSRSMLSKVRALRTERQADAIKRCIRMGDDKSEQSALQWYIHAAEWEAIRSVSCYQMYVFAKRLERCIHTSQANTSTDPCSAISVFMFHANIHSVQKSRPLTHGGDLSYPIFTILSLQVIQ